jgi:acetyl esterase
MLDPQVQALLQLMIDKGIAPTHTLSPEGARDAYVQRRFATQNQPAELATVSNSQCQGPHGAIGLRIYRPDTAPTHNAGALMFYHGGGWVIGDLDTHDVLCRDLALQAQCVVIAVDYRLAPENPFPAAVDDAVAAFAWAADNAESLGIDPQRIAVGGDSAGGNLAAVVSLLRRDAARQHSAAVQPCFQLLIYPATDMRAISPSHTSNGQGYLLTADTMAYFRSHYSPEPAQWADWRASPLLHPDLGSLPPALVLTAGFDPLRDEGLEYADALSAAGNRCQYVCFARQIHGFILMGKVLNEANTAVSLCAQELRKALA